MDSFAIIDAGIRYLAYILIIIGVPTLIWLNKFWYSQSLKAKEDQINLLKEMQYDRAQELIRAQKDLFDEERKNLKKIISNFNIEEEDTQKQIDEVTKKIENMTNQLQQVLKNRSEKILKIE
jgi:hypothetical protein